MVLIRIQCHMALPLFSAAEAALGCQGKLEDQRDQSKSCHLLKNTGVAYDQCLVSTWTIPSLGAWFGGWPASFTSIGSMIVRMFGDIAMISPLLRQSFLFSSMTVFLGIHVLLAPQHQNMAVTMEASLLHVLITKSVRTSNQGYAAQQTATGEEKKKKNKRRKHTCASIPVMICVYISAYTYSCTGLLWALFVHALQVNAWFILRRTSFEAAPRPWPKAHVLDPHSVNGPIKDQPLALLAMRSFRCGALFPCAFFQACLGSTTLSAREPHEGGLCVSSVGVGFCAKRMNVAPCRSRIITQLWVYSILSGLRPSSGAKKQPLHGVPIGNPIGKPLPCSKQGGGSQVNLPFLGGTPRNSLSLSLPLRPEGLDSARPERSSTLIHPTLQATQNRSCGRSSLRLVASKLAEEHRHDAVRPLLDRLAGGCQRREWDKSDPWKMTHAGSK